MRSLAVAVVVTAASVSAADVSTIAELDDDDRLELTFRVDCLQHMVHDLAIRPVVEGAVSITIDGQPRYPDDEALTVELDRRDVGRLDRAIELYRDGDPDACPGPSPLAMRWIRGDGTRTEESLGATCGIEESETVLPLDAVIRAAEPCLSERGAEMLSKRAALVFVGSVLGERRRARPLEWLSTWIADRVNGGGSGRSVVVREAEIAVERSLGGTAGQRLVVRLPPHLRLVDGETYFFVAAQGLDGNHRLEFADARCRTDGLEALFD